MAEKEKIDSRAWTGDIPNGPVHPETDFAFKASEYEAILKTERQGGYGAGFKPKITALLGGLGCFLVAYIFSRIPNSPDVPIQYAPSTVTFLFVLMGVLFVAGLLSRFIRPVFRSSRKGPTSRIDVRGKELHPVALSIFVVVLVAVSIFIAAWMRGAL